MNLSQFFDFIDIAPPVENRSYTSEHTHHEDGEYTCAYSFNSIKNLINRVAVRVEPQSHEKVTS